MTILALSIASLRKYYQDDSEPVIGMAIGLGNLLSAEISIFKNYKA